jgi:plastocyanin
VNTRQTIRHRIRWRRGSLAAVLCAAALLALAALAAGCGSSSATTVTINGNQLDKPMLTVSTGTTVTWVNTDQTANTITSDGVNTDSSLMTKAGPGQFNSGPLNPGESFSFTFDTAGTYKYSSVIHGYITGTVMVQ